MEWRRRWLYELRWAPEAKGPRVHNRAVGSVAELRAVVEWARQRPDVTKVSYRPVDELEGDLATVCPNGHPLDGGTATRARVGWLDCPGCPGHHVQSCVAAGCGAEVVEPAMGPDCRPRAPKQG